MVATRPTVPCDFRLSWAASAGSITLSWLPVSTMNSNGPDWLIFTGITSRGPGDNSRSEACDVTRAMGFCLAENGRDRELRWRERHRGNCRAMGVSCRPPLAGASRRRHWQLYLGYLNGLRIESMSMKYGEDVDRHNC